MIVSACVGVRGSAVWSRRRLAREHVREPTDTAEIAARGRDDRPLPPTNFFCRAFLAFFGNIWEHFWNMFGTFSKQNETFLGTFWKHLRTGWEHLGTCLENLGKC